MARTNLGEQLVELGFNSHLRGTTFPSVLILMSMGLVCDSGLPKGAYFMKMVLKAVRSVMFEVSLTLISLPNVFQTKPHSVPYSPGLSPLAFVLQWKILQISRHIKSTAP